MQQRNRHIKFSFVLGIFSLATLLSCGRYNASVLEKIAEEENMLCPVKLDEYTVEDSVKAQPENKLYYYYTINNFAKEYINEAFIENMQANLMGKLRNTMQVNASTKLLTNHGVVFVHLYKFESGELIKEFVITPDDYKK